MILEKKILSLVKEYQQAQLTLKTIFTGIGQKTALFSIVVTDEFHKFENPLQLCRYYSYNPRVWQ
jgi:hypothetical protein